VQSISASIKTVCWKTLQEVNRDSMHCPAPNNSAKNYMSAKLDTFCSVHITAMLCFTGNKKESVLVMASTLFLDL
jgi:hypothetical protein